MPLCFVPMRPQLSVGTSSKRSLPLAASSGLGVWVDSLFLCFLPHRNICVDFEEDFSKRELAVYGACLGVCSVCVCFNFWCV